MKDLNNEFSDEERQRILKDFDDLLNQIRNSSGNVFTCGINKGLEMQKEHFENQTEFNESEKRTRNILISQVNKANLLKVLEETSSLFQALNLKSPKYSVTHGKSFLAEDGALYSQIYIQPKQPVFFMAKVGDKKDIELFALTITVKLIAEESDVKIEILSHFNPDVFRNVKIEYSGIVTTGVNRHLKLELPISTATEELKNNVTNGINESASYYFK